MASTTCRDHEDRLPSVHMITTGGGGHDAASFWVLKWLKGKTETIFFQPFQGQKEGRFMSS